MKMKYRGLIPIALVILMGVSIYSMIANAISDKNKVKELISKAIVCEEQGLYDKAASYYRDILEVDENVKYYLAASDMYFSAGQFEESRSWSEKAISEFPKEASTYERKIKACLKMKSYSEAFETLEQYDGRKLSSKPVEKYRKQMQFLYWEDGLPYDQIKQYSGQYVAFNTKGKWGLASTKGASKVRAKFADVGYYANGFVAVLDEKGTWYFMNEEGEYLYNISKSVGGKVTEVGLYNNELVPICVNGKYHYYNLNFEKKFEEYDYAGSFSGGVAAVKKGKKWSVIDSNGKSINDVKYEDVVLDERGVCCQKERVFVKINDDDYIMIDNTGKRIGTETFDGAKVFGNDEYAAVMRGKLWGFVDFNGKIIIEPYYEDASSFSMGLAAVKNNELWGYIDKDKTEVIEMKYHECRNFSQSGAAFVKSKLYWNVIKLYQYNN